MPDPSEVIQQHMEDTRSALHEKLETLENQVLGTVTEANAAVKETVANVKEAVEETVASVKTAFDLELQMDRHPWAFVGGAVALGYVGGSLLIPRHPDAAPTVPMPAMPPSRESSGHASRTEAPSRPLDPRDQKKGSLLGGLAKIYRGELEKLKSLAIGAAAGLVRDLVLESAPEPFRSQFSDVLNEVAVELGGDTVQGPQAGRALHDLFAKRSGLAYTGEDRDKGNGSHRPNGVNGGS